MAFQGDSIYWVEVEKVVPNPFQPRREFDQHKLQELADSIRMYGVLQPLTVTRQEVQREDGTFYSEYELIAGERRLRASKLAGVAQVPVIIREGEQNEQEKLELAIIENLQREDLNAVDRAIAFKQLADAFGLSHAQVAEKVGRSREYVSNSIRLLGLPEHMLDSLKYGDMMEGHARTLLMLSDRPEEQEVVYKEILLKKLSVREVERIVRKIATDKVRKKNPKDLDSHLIEFEKKFTETLGTRVQIQKTDFGGKLTIDYFSEDDLVLILSKMNEEGKVLPVNRQEELEKIATHTPLQMVDEPVATEPINQLSHETAAIETEPNPVNQPEQDKFISLVDQVEEESVHRETIEPVVLEDAPIETMAEAKEDNLATESTDTSSSEWPNQAFQRPSEVTTVNANPSPVFGITEDPSSRPETLTETRHEHEADQQPKRDNEDDSNLYSINNFTV